MTFINLAVIIAVGMLVGGCSTGKGGSPDAGGDAVTSPPPGGCGVVLYSDPACQTWLDTNCCDFERRCDSGCRTIIACVNACPSPKTDDCLGTCAGNFDQSTLDDLANCSKSVAPPTGLTCEWP